ncbi:alpha-glucosidase [Coleofasciculus sp.]|uniref:alpha-glucosidase n=1 Tax=Coleofasciculus sp. TaxID=3100458 RepID=UPI003A2CF80E
MQTVKWWQNAVIYHIVPRSFLDTSGDGEGDLNGIIAKLDYIAALGVDAIWLCPIYESPREDLGYDPTDLRSIDPMYGSLEDFQRLLALAHARGLKVIVDQIWSHTSDRHPWFQESRSSRDNPKADWYVWADPKPDGSPPNNWRSAFLGDSAWTWSPERGQYYFHNFLKSQPDLNWHNPAVIEAVLAEARFWLELGVDGFRLDAVNFYFHDQELRDNPVRPADASLPDGISPKNPFAHQLFKYNFCRPETIEVLKHIREFVQAYPGVITLGEVTLAEDSIALSSEYVGDQRLHLAYNSALLFDESISATRLYQTLEKVLTHFPDGGNCWCVGNHDYGRLRSCWTGKEASGKPYPEGFYQMMVGLLLSLPGAFCLYQGDELGLPVARIPEDIPVEEIKDPFGKALYPILPGRDGSRTPIPWIADSLHGGFTTASKPWLPVPQSHRERAVNLQDNEPNSLLNTWRRFLHWRKQQPALMRGDCQMLKTEEPIFGLIRETEEQRLICLFNLSEIPTEYDLSPYAECQTIRGIDMTAQRQGNILKIPAYGTFFGNLPPAKENYPPFSPPLVQGRKGEGESDRVMALS